MGLVTDLSNKYWSDPFYRSEFNVILLQFIYAGVTLFIVSFSFNYLYQDVSEILIGGITESIRQGKVLSAGDIIQTIEVVKTEKFYGFLILTTLITFGFSYVIAKITLSPARNALNSQKRFVSDIAHELRTPLSIIKANSEVALMDDKLQPKLRKTMVSIVEELDRTSDIINNLLSFSNIVRPERIIFDIVDMGKIVDSSFAKLKELAEKKGLEVDVKKINPSTVLGNATALEQVVINLLKNSINYTSKGGHISIRIEPDYRGSIILTVEDSGIGISKNDLLHIFEPFYRAERSRNRESGSSGLGLTIVSELIKLHSGKITIKSLPSRGTTVVVSLPYLKNDKSIRPDNKNESVEIDPNEVSVNFLNKNKTK